MKKNPAKKIESALIWNPGYKKQITLCYNNKNNFLDDNPKCPCHKCLVVSMCLSDPSPHTHYWVVAKTCKNLRKYLEKVYPNGRYEYVNE